MPNHWWVGMYYAGQPGRRLPVPIFQALEDFTVYLILIAIERRLDRWLGALLAKGGSDLLLVPGAPVCILHEGGVRNLEAEPLNGSEIEAIVLPALTPHALQQYRAGHIADSSYRISGLGRFRINLHRERGQAAAARPFL